MVFSFAIAEYFKNIKASVAFVVLILFAPIFLFLADTSRLIFSSGSFFLNYDQTNIAPFLFLGTVIIILLEILVYSLLTAVIVMAVKRNISKQEPKFLYEGIKKHTFKLTGFYFLQILLFFILGNIFLVANLPIWILLLIILTVGLAVFYVPQVLIVDECQLDHAISGSIEFMVEKKKELVITFLFAVILVIAATILEFGFDLFFVEALPGRLLSTILILGIVVPLVEIVKTYFFMNKYELIRRTMN